MWVCVLHHRGLPIILFNLHVRVGPYSQRICYSSVQIAYECRSLLTETLLSSFSDCMWVWVLHHCYTEDWLSSCSDCMWVWDPTHRGFATILFRLHVRVGPSLQKICYRPVQIACESGSLLTEDLLSSFTDCMWEWILTHRGFIIACSDSMWVRVLTLRGFAIALFRLHVSAGPYSQRICYRPFQIACECGSFKEIICRHSLQTWWNGSITIRNFYFFVHIHYCSK